MINQTNDHYNNSNNDIGSFPVKVVFFTKNRIISEEQFRLDSSFGDIIEFFQIYLCEEGKTKLKRFYLFNGVKTSVYEKLINLVNIQTNNSPINSDQIIEFSFEIEEIEKLDDELLQSFETLLQPKINPFGIFVYKPKEGIITLEHYPIKIAEKFELKKYNEFSAYCNSPKKLFVSGGKSTENIYKDFWIIDNKKYSIIKKSMPFIKANHSMIYININNEEFIFIAGGDTNKFCFYYDIHSNIFVNWIEMNSYHIKPALYQFENFLYCFDIYDKNEYYFERTNLVTDNNNTKWEKIIPKINNGINIVFPTNFLGVSSCNNGQIFLIGGQENINTYLYYPAKNNLSLNENTKLENLSLSDKLFYKVNKFHNVALPSTLYEKKEIIVINKIKTSIRIIKFIVSDGLSKVKFKDNYNVSKQNSEYGNIFLKIKQKENKKLQIQSQKIENEITNNNIKNIINNNLNNNINNNNNFSIQQQNAEIEENNKILNEQNNLEEDNLLNEEELVNAICSYKKEIMKNQQQNSDGKYVKTKNLALSVIKENENENEKNNEEDEEEFEEAEEDEKRLERDLFKNTLEQNLSQDIIQIEDFPKYHYNENTFCDYELK